MNLKEIRKGIIKQYLQNINLKDDIFKTLNQEIENRLDDELDTILKRYDIYMKTTKPVLDFYSKNPNFHEIDGSQEIDEIIAKIDTFLKV